MGFKNYKLSTLLSQLLLLKAALTVTIISTDLYFRSIVNNIFPKGSFPKAKQFKVLTTLCEQYSGHGF